MSDNPLPEPANSRGSRGVNIIFWFSAVALIVLLALIAIPNLIHARTNCCRNSCIANLKQIDGAIQQWAREQKKESTDSPEMAGVITYLKGGRMPECPKGGTYILPQTIFGDTRCSKGDNH